ncbi:putative signal peptide protein [Puccinia sorghi]|uniref:Putative signal peptide protein n=1 Tax=Puccinia sorghi TaxID=27349 RepID=A0A0L6VIF2_9BASI|nr:putative signal peptide protein [Puccinia sorghi]
MQVLSLNLLISSVIQQQIFLKLVANWLDVILKAHLNLSKIKKALGYDKSQAAAAVRWVSSLSFKQSQSKNLDTVALEDLKTGLGERGKRENWLAEDIWLAFKALVCFFVRFISYSAFPLQQYHDCTVKKRFGWLTNFYWLGEFCGFCEASVIKVFRCFYSYSQCNHNIKKEYHGHKMVTSLRFNHIILLMILHSLLEFKYNSKKKLMSKCLTISNKKEEFKSFPIYTKEERLQWTSLRIFQNLSLQLSPQEGINLSGIRLRVSMSPSPDDRHEATELIQFSSLMWRSKWIATVDKHFACQNLPLHLPTSLIHVACLYVLLKKLQNICHIKIMECYEIYPVGGCPVPRFFVAAKGSGAKISSDPPCLILVVIERASCITKHSFLLGCHFVSAFSSSEEPCQVLCQNMLGEMKGKPNLIPALLPYFLCMYLGFPCTCESSSLLLWACSGTSWQLLSANSGQPTYFASKNSQIKCNSFLSFYLLCLYYLVSKDTSSLSSLWYLWFFHSSKVLLNDMISSSISLLIFPVFQSVSQLHQFIKKRKTYCLLKAALSQSALNVCCMPALVQSSKLTSDPSNKNTHHFPPPSFRLKPHKLPFTYNLPCPETWLQCMDRPTPQPQKQLI